MNITLALNVFAWRIGTFDIHIKLDPTTPTTQPVIDRGVKKMSNWWTRRMTA